MSNKPPIPPAALAEMYRTLGDFFGSIARDQQDAAARQKPGAVMASPTGLESHDAYAAANNRTGPAGQ
jgi:hypothetical protein